MYISAIEFATSCATNSMSRFMLSPSEGGDVVLPLYLGEGEAPYKRLVAGQSRVKAQQGGFGCVNEIRHAASLVFLSKKSLANAYETFATIRKGR